MSIKGRSIRFLPEQFREFDERDIIWLWQHLKKDGFEPGDSHSGDVDGLTRQVGRFLRGHDSLNHDAIFEAKLISMVGGDDLKSIDKGNPRILSFLINVLRYKFGFDFNDPVVNSCFDDWFFFTAILDCSNKPLVDKKTALKEGLMLWSLNSLHDHIFEWFDEKDGDQGLWLLDEAEKSSLPKSIEGRANFPVNVKQRFVKFKCLMDQSGLPGDFKKTYMAELKRKWRAKGRIKSKGKFQSNVLVTKETKEGIERLKKEYGLKTRGEVIDRLVSRAVGNQP